MFLLHKLTYTLYNRHIALSSCFYIIIQLFQERLSYKGGKAYAMMLKVILGNGAFCGGLSEPVLKVL